MAPKRAITNLYLSKYYRGKKTKNLPRTTTFDSRSLKDDHFWVVTRAVVLYGFDCTNLPFTNCWAYVFRKSLLYCCLKTYNIFSSSTVLVWIEVSIPPTPLLFSQSPLQSINCPYPPFYAISHTLHTVFLWTTRPRPLKIEFFSERPWY